MTYRFIKRTQAIPIPCSECGNIRLFPPSYLKNWPNPTCSRACRWARKARQPSTRTKRPCTICGTAIYASPSSFEKYGKKVCGKQCQGALNSRRQMANPEMRFWQKVDKNGPLPDRNAEFGNCWPRDGSNVKGYSVMSFQGSNHLATHVAWMLSTGEPFPDGKWALHTCDYPACVRNDEVGVYIVNGITYERRGHLWLGTHRDNMADSHAKERYARIGHSMPGESHPMAKLNDILVRDMRRLATEGIPLRTIATMIGTSETTVSNVVHRKTWKHVE